MSENIPIFTCKCDAVKSHRLKFDGGTSGVYFVELCFSCYTEQDRKFLLKDEEI